MTSIKSTMDIVQENEVRKALVYQANARGGKNRCFQIVVLEKTLASPLDCKEIQPVYPKGDQSWVFIGRTVVEAETPILWQIGRAHV